MGHEHEGLGFRIFGRGLLGAWAQGDRRGSRVISYMGVSENRGP